LLLPLLALITGCSNPTRDPNLYRQLIGGPATQPAFDPQTPLSLHEALRLANADNESIASKGEDYIQALAEKMKEAGVFLPTISLAPTYSISKGGGGGFLIGGLTSGSSGGAVTGGTGSTSSGGSSSSGSIGSIQLVSSGSGVSHDFTVPVQATYTGSLSNLSTLEAAAVTIDQRAQLVVDEQETILLNVVQSYYNALKFERQAASYESSLNAKAEKVRDQEARQRLGNVRPLDVAQSQSDLAANQVLLTQALTDAANARSGLARLIGVPAVNGPLSDNFDPPAAVPELQAWQQLANQHRQDLLAASHAVEAARLKVDAAIREYLPSVSINFDWFLYNDPHSSQLWSGGVSANIPIFSALSIEADVRGAWSQYRQAGLARSQTVRQVTDDINQNYRNVLNSREKIKELEVEVAAAAKAFDLAERAYKLGSLSNLDRLTQQDNLLTAQLNLVSEQFNEKSSYLGLLRASGMLGSVIRSEKVVE
jgi:outer membrane protein TolC